MVVRKARQALTLLMPRAILGARSVTKSTNIGGADWAIEGPHRHLATDRLQLSQPPSSPPPPIVRVASAAAVLVGTTVIVGWTCDIQILKTILPGMVSIKVNTAGAFILTGMALGLSTTQQHSRMRNAVAGVAALAVALIGGITLAEYALDTNLGIDELVTTDDQPQDWTLYPGRSAPATAASFLLLGIALLLLPSARVGPKRLVRSLVLVVFLASGIAIVGFFYGVRSPYSVRPHFWMPLPTAATFVIACVGVLCFRPNSGLTFPARGHDLRGELARRLIPIVVGVPIILGWLHLVGATQGFYNFEFAMASYATTMILFLSMLVWWSGRLLKVADEQRTRAEEDMRSHRAALTHALQLSTIGEIAAGLAHELNQPLSAIHNWARGTVRRLRNGQHSVPELVEISELIADESARASQIIQRLSLHAKKWDRPREMLDINTVSRHATRVIGNLAERHGVAVSIHSPPNLPNIQGDAIQIEQVVINLLRNGIDAMAECRHEKRLLIDISSVDANVEVIVADNGCGLPDDNAIKIFEAFFTTKPRGLGMGLAISRSIIEAHEGRLWAESNPNGGATFRFTLPVARELPNED